MKHTLTITATALLLAACGSGGGSSSAAVVGIDRSGTYSMNGIECYNDQDQLVASSGFTNGLQVTWQISGNSITTTGQLGLCTVVISGSIAFTADNYYSATGRSVTSATNSSCSIGMVIGGGITPASDIGTATVGQRLVDSIDRLYVYDADTKRLGIYNDTLTAGAGSFCFNVYQKQ